MEYPSAHRDGGGFSGVEKSSVSTTGKTWDGERHDGLKSVLERCGFLVFHFWRFVSSFYPVSGSVGFSSFVLDQHVSSKEVGRY